MSTPVHEEAPADPASIETYREQVEEAAAVIRDASGSPPKLGLVLGTGLGELVDMIDENARLRYEDIPHFPVSTVDTHSGHLILGTLHGMPVAALQGRFHLYEGYSPKEVTFPIRVLGTLGVETLFISNAAGGMNPHFSAGDLMLITDHINLQGANPLVGPNVDDWGPRFPDMSEPYDPDLRALASENAMEQGLKLQEGVYVAVPGPNLETKAEYRMLRRLGADAVGMSTVPEVIVARHMGIRVMAVSVITDECFPDALEPVSLEDVLSVAGTVGPALTQLVDAVVADLTDEMEVA
jgi:purine-nucleoside phosphorylase